MRVDGGRAIDVGEGPAAVRGDGGEDGLPKELERVFGGASCIFST